MSYEERMMPSHERNWMNLWGDSPKGFFLLGNPLSLTVEYEIWVGSIKYLWNLHDTEKLMNSGRKECEKYDTGIPLKHLILMITKDLFIEFLRKKHTFLMLDWHFEALCHCHRIIQLSLGKQEKKRLLSFLFMPFFDLAVFPYRSRGNYNILFWLF